MGSPYIGEIRMFGGNFAPAGWAFCDGSLLAIADNDALFALIGTTYGGDGQTTFALPDLRGRAPIHMGTGPGLSPYVIGQAGGTETVTLTVNQVPSHTHPVPVITSSAQSTSPAGAYLATPANNVYFPPPPSGTVALSSSALQPAGGSQPHENTQPFVCISFIISLFGIFPSQA